WDDGLLYRYNTRDLNTPAEVVHLLEERGPTLTSARFLIGRTTLLVGDSSGRVRGWFGTRPTPSSTSDGIILRPAHDFPGKGEPVTALAASSRVHLFTAGHGDGRVGVHYSTSEKHLADVQTQAGQPVRRLAIAPRDDGILALTSKGL